MLINEVKRALALAESIVERPIQQFLDDDEAVFALRYAVVEVVEGCVQIGIHILKKLGARAATYSEVFQRLYEKGVITRSVAESMRRFVGLRNLIVHRYWELDDERMYKELKEEGLRRVKEYLESVAKYASVV